MAGSEKIQGLPQPPHQLPPSKTATTRPHASDTTAESHHHTDTVELSPENTEYQKFLKRINQAPDIRPDRLDRIRQALEAGTYRIDSEIVADRLVRESLINNLTTNQPPDTPPDPNLP